MNKRILITAAVALAGTLTASFAGEIDDIKAAAKKLTEGGNYSWSQTTEVPEGNGFRPGPTTGKMADGTVVIRSSFRDTESISVLKGEKGAMTNRDGDWQSLAEVENSEGFGRFRAARLRNFESPAAQAVAIAEGITEWKSENGVLSGELSKEAAKELMMFRRGRGGQNGGPEIFGAIGDAKFWIKDGVLQKYQFHVEGLMEFNGNDRDIDRTTIIEIKDVGSTKVEIPEGAKSKLS